jgi:hypothetical protein
MEVKLPGRDADHSPPTGTEIKNAWSYTTPHTYIFIAHVAKLSTRTIKLSTLLILWCKVFPLSRSHRKLPTLYEPESSLPC